MKIFKVLHQYPLRQGDDFIPRVFKLAIPMVLQQLVTTFVNLLDNLMVGQLGDAAISGVASANKFFMIGMYAVFGLSAASGIYISQFEGAGQEERVKQSYLFSILSSGLVAVLFILPGIFMPRSIGAFFTPEKNILEPVAQYMPLAALAIIPQIYSINTQGAMRCLGETRVPLFLSFTTVVSNTVFNYIFIFGHLGMPAMGVKGAALGTLLARSLELILTYLAVKRGSYAFKVPLLHIFRVPKPLSLAILKRALPLCLNEMGYGAGMAMLFKFYGTRGLGVLAAMNIMGTVTELFFVLFSGMAVATTVIVSRPLGANQLEEARSNAYRIYKLSFLLAIFFALLMFGSSFIFPSFYNVTEDVRGMATFFIRIYSLFYLVYTVNAQGYFILRAGGDTKHTLMMDAGYFWLVNLPTVGLAAYLTDWSVLVLFLLGQMTDFFKVFVSTTLLMRESWLKNLTGEVDS